MVLRPSLMPRQTPSTRRALASRAAVAAPKLAKGIPSGKPQPKAEPVAKRGPNIASIKVGLSTLATKTGQGTVKKAAGLDRHEVQDVYGVLNNWSRKNLKTSMQEADLPFGSVAQTAPTRGAAPPRGGPLTGGRTRGSECSGHTT